MSTDVLQKALDRERELKTELEEIQAFIKVYKKLFCDSPAEEITRRSVGTDDEKSHGSSETAAESATTPKPSRRRRSASKKNEVIEAARRILKGRSSPLKNAALTDLIIESGLDIPSANKPRYISTTLSHSDEFVAAKKRAGWMLAEQVEDNLRQQYDASYNNAPDTSASGALFEKDFE